jgi:DNA-binding NarL/FixJ family response regulator
MDPAGHSVSTAATRWVCRTSGLQAVGWLKPDLVIVDLSLPVSGSVNVVHTLFSRCAVHTLFCPLPTLRVALSVHDEHTAISQALAVGAVGLVLKRTAGVSGCS